MKGAFECTHCGACCKKETSPVNITLGDIKRIAKFLGKDPKDVIGNEIKIRPFMDANEPGRFELELGLPKPCHFWKDDRCSIYSARPLNCRLFPFWLYATQPDATIKEQTLPGYECIINSEVDTDHRMTYAEYSRRLSTQLMTESKETDEFMEIHDFFDEITLDGHDEEILLVLEGPGPKTEETFVKIVRAAEKKISNERYLKLPEAISEHLKNPEHKSASIEDMEKIDLVLSGRYDS
ncbi:MAG: YkgJ family cysteine cluster protein [Nanoarchaeota archaeon]